MTPFEHVVDELLASRASDGVWIGRLSSSALAGAVAIRALKSVDPDAHKDLIRDGTAWLASNQNEDGGWGDTVRSPSNVSTTLLVLASLHDDPECVDCLDRARTYLGTQFGSMDPQAIVDGVLRRYGNDRTFSAPILAMAAVAGILGPETEGWRHVPQLPFELAALPRVVFKWIRLDVVSYALPALIAIGYLRHARRPKGFALTRAIRSRCIRPLLTKLEGMQPSNGGFLEAVPLTAFVTMALAESGFADHTIVRRGAAFLAHSVREDGSWPIDTNLSTWITSQALKGVPLDRLSVDERQRLRRWYEEQQFTSRHPFTGSAPGGWGWTPLPGSVPDADDTAGALIALRRLMEDAEPTQTVLTGVSWLLTLQNSDGGVPTFCRGWGRLPFDRSCPDVTAHAVEAVTLWLPSLPANFKRPVKRFLKKSIDYLRNAQRDDGSWLPLWFGNHHGPNQENPCYGTAMVVGALANVRNELAELYDEAPVARGVAWLWANRNDDGGWGGCNGTPSSREETALALAALATVGTDERLTDAEAWLNDNWSLPPTPIGLYFSSLWYFEEAYPLAFAARARAALELTRSAPESAS